MAELVADCPRCRSKRITFDVHYIHPVGTKHRWQRWFEAFSICRQCDRTSTFLVYQRAIAHEDVFTRPAELVAAKTALNRVVDIHTHISAKDESTVPPPEHLPPDIEAAFVEGAKCNAIGCHNAAATMFRLCLDLSTRQLLPDSEENGLTAKVRRDLGLRIPWLLNNERLPASLRELSTCIKEDGNDGAHRGTLQKSDADDLMDFTIAVLERLHTEPERIKLANERRVARRAATEPPKS